MSKNEDRIQEIRAILVADEGRPQGEERQKLLDELHELETQG
jgi:hypothetical protein